MMGWGGVQKFCPMGAGNRPGATDLAQTQFFRHVRAREGNQR